MELLPAIILYSPIYQKYFQYIGNFDITSMYNFILNAIEKKYNGKDISLKEVDYKFENKQIKRNKQNEL